MRKINIDNFTFEVNGKIVGVVTETKENYNVTLKPMENKNGISKKSQK